MTGRPPKPNATKRVTGSRHAHRDLPEPPPGSPRCPAHLCKDAREHWAATVAVLAPNVLTVADADALALYCTAYARWVEAERHLAEEGVVVKSPNNYPIQNPYLAVSNKAHEQIEKMGARFGLNPADRNRLHGVAPKDERDEFEEWEGGPRLAKAQ